LRIYAARTTRLRPDGVARIRRIGRRQNLISSSPPKDKKRGDMMRNKTTTKITPICVQSRSTTTTLCVRVERTNSFYFVPLYDSFFNCNHRRKMFWFPRRVH
jgi:hypothetical protein